MNKKRVREIKREYKNIFGKEPTKSQLRSIKKSYKEDPQNYFNDLKEYVGRK